GLCSFTDCHADYYGGGLYARIDGVNSRLILQDGLIFKRCTGSQGGGGIQLYSYYNISFVINKVSFIECYASWFGGGINIEGGYETLKFNGTLFERCYANEVGGLSIYVYNENVSLELISITFIGCYGDYAGGLFIRARISSQVTSLGQCQFQDCSGEDGGGIYLQISNQCLFEINNASLKNCSCTYQSGGLRASIESGGKLIIDSSQFIQCQCNRGNGGGIFVEINFPSQSSFIIKDTLIQECKALNSSFSQLGFGGGLFLGVNGDYDPSSKLIDLRGMKIYNNTADKYGQSLYIVMRDVVRLCQYGILGEYVKEEEEELEQDVKPDTKEGFTFPYWGIILIAVPIRVNRRKEKSKK
ncbi:MAG: hypothetical protein EZS28_027841, partial [Streblomastix strix]